MYSENSQADDVDFLLKLIKKVGEDVPEADMEDVTIYGMFNGARLIYRLLMENRNPRPFKRVIPLVSSLINIQYHDNSFWLEDQTTQQWTDFFCEQFLSQNCIIRCYCLGPRVL